MCDGHHTCPTASTFGETLAPPNLGFIRGTSIQEGMLSIETQNYRIILTSIKCDTINPSPIVTKMVIRFGEYFECDF